MKVLILFLVICGAYCDLIEPFGTELCRLFANDVKLRVPGTCAAYQTCKDGVGIVTECSANQLYNKDTGKCVKSVSDDYCSSSCTNKTQVAWVTDPKSCTGYFKCVNAVATQGECKNNLHFSQELQACIFAEDSSCKGYAYCDVVPNNVPFKSEDDCQEYHVCEKSKLVNYYCEDGYYHGQNGCVPRSEVECDLHPIPISICGTVKKPIRKKFVSDKRSCPGYYYCKDAGDNVPDPDPNWGQCPEGRFFEPNLEVCYPAAAVNCEWNRCEGRKRSMVISGTAGCQHYLICNGDDVLSEEKCPDGLYFNDDLMECTATFIQYGACS